MKIKIITGYNEDQKYTIDSEEAHKAYYLFRNPEKRGVFSNGLALIGKDIQRIIPDWNATMGWNNTHKLDDDDWNEINSKGIGEKMTETMSLANRIAYQIQDNPVLLNKPLSQIESLTITPSTLPELLEGINKL